MAFLQPDMVDIERIPEEDFPLKVGYTMILLEFRVQESPKTHMCIPPQAYIDRRKYLRVSELLLIDTITHLKSNIPIQCRRPVARSQLLNRESVSPADGLPPAQQSPATSPTSAFLQPAASHTSPSPHTARSPVAKRLPLFESSPNLASSQFQTGRIVRQRIRASFGYNPSTPENLMSLKMLQDKKHGDYIDCFAVIETVYRVKRVDSLGKDKRDLDIIDPSQPRRTILSGNSLKFSPVCYLSFFVFSCLMLTGSLAGCRPIRAGERGYHSP